MAVNAVAVPVFIMLAALPMFFIRRKKRFGIKPYDALHTASAEYGNADVFLTTDHRLISALNRAKVEIKVKNPLVWLMEVLHEREFERD